MKSLSNWEKKSQYLLTEIVKYDSYIDSLQSAMNLRLKKRGEKGKKTFVFLHRYRLILRLFSFGAGSQWCTTD